MKKTIQLRSRVMTLANYLKKSMNFGEALRTAWAIAKLQRWLKEGGEAVIRFFKSGSDIPEQRIATAVNSDNYTSKGTARRRNPLQITYYDHNRQSVRSFNAARFAGFVAVQ